MLLDMLLLDFLCMSHMVMFIFWQDVRICCLQLYLVVIVARPIASALMKYIKWKNRRNRTSSELLLFMLTGRVHSAVVSGINEESASVTVEWFEHNETKGKEVCWYA